jgi:DNA-binding winged helix-turn-helix (wHTH) protein
MNADNPHERYGVGELVLDVDACMLTRFGVVVPLPPKTFALLVTLVRRAPGVVRRQELVDTVWPRELVNDEALTQRVMLLRRALGDEVKKPRYIASMPRWGYRLVAPVERIGASPLPVAEQAESPAARGTPCVVIHGGKETSLLEGENILGRDSAAVVRIDSLDVSRRHARIVVSLGQAVLEDLGSKNGTFVRGHRLEGPTRLADGDTIAVGPILLTFRVVSLAGTTVTNPLTPPRVG